MSATLTNWLNRVPETAAHVQAIMDAVAAEEVAVSEIATQQAKLHRLAQLAHTLSRGGSNDQTVKQLFTGL